jgi:hypothetical protein
LIKGLVLGIFTFGSCEFDRIVVDVFSFFDDEILLLVLVEYNQHTLGKISMYHVFSKSIRLLRKSVFSIFVVKSSKILFVFDNFDHHNYIYVKNRYHFRNQRKNLSWQRKYVCITPQVRFSLKTTERSTGVF